MSSHGLIAKSAGIIGSLTGVSRILGFIRDMVIASAFGTGVAAEAFVVSFKLPNLLRDLVGEGATNAAFVPVLTETREKNKEDFWPLVSTLFVALSLVLIALTIGGIVFAPAIVSVIAPGFVDSADPDKFPLAVQLTRTIFPYIFLIGLSALAMGILNSLKEFTSSALGPVLLNLCIIAAAFFYEREYGPMALVFGVLAGGVLQVACQIPPLLKSGFRFTRPRFGIPGVRKVGKLLVPRALGSAIYQINVFVDSILASFASIVGPGGQSALYYSNRLFQLPLAIFGIALAQAVLPAFSAQAVHGDREGLKDTLRMTLTSLAFIVLPSAVGLLTLSEPIVRIIFERGRFDAYSTHVTSSALFFYAFGLLSCCFIKMFVNVFYAMQDTRTPVKTMAFSVAVNVALSLILMRPLQVGGLALASSISATLNAALLYVLLRRRIGALDERRIAASFLKTLTAAAVMGIFSYFYGRLFLASGATGSYWAQGFWLFLGIGISVLIYFAAAFLLKAEEMKRFFRPKEVTAK